MVPKSSSARTVFETLATCNLQVAGEKRRSSCVVVFHQDFASLRIIANNLERPSQETRKKLGRLLLVTSYTS